MPAERPLNLLLLEDDEDDFFIVSSLVRDVWGSGARVEWASKVAAALDALQNGQFDAVLVDYNLGGENGLDFIRSAAALGRRTPCIVLTGYSSALLYRQARRAGAVGYIDKEHLDGPRLRRAVEFAIRRARP